MESFSIVMVVLIALVVFTVFKGVRIVPQGYKSVSYTHLTLPTNREV